MVAGIDVAGQQPGRHRVGPADDQRGDVQHVGGQPGGDELGDRLLGGHQHLASHVAALLRRGELVLEVDRGRPRLDHGLHQLEGVEHAAEARLGVGDDRRIPVGHLLAQPRAGADLVGPLQGVVDPPHQRGHAIDRVEALIGIGLLGGVRVAGHLPAADVNRLQPRLHHFHGLGPGLGPQRADVRLRPQQPPEAFRPQAGQRVLDLHAAPQPHHVVGRIRAVDLHPTIVHLP